MRRTLCRFIAVAAIAVAQTAMGDQPGNSDVRAVVKTDLLVAHISSSGGDLVELELTRHKATEDKSKNFVLLDDGKEHTYLAQTGLLGDGLPTHKTQFQLTPGTYEMKPGSDTLELRLQAPEAGGVKVTKLYTFHRNSYLIDVGYEITNGNTNPLSAHAYYQLVRDGIASPRGMTSAATFTGPAVYTEEGKFQEIEFADIDKGKAQFVQVARSGWIAMVQQRYFVAGWIPPGNDKREFFVRKVADNLYSAGVILPVPVVAPGQSVRIDVPLYTGPQEQGALKKVAPGFDLLSEPHTAKLQYQELEVPELRRLAETGDAKAQSSLGGHYRLGQGVPRDYREALRWYRKAAEQGYVPAQYNLGRLYADGLGVSKNEKEAASWYRKAAEQGDADAQNSLGVMYALGRGVPQNLEVAVGWYRKAAEQGDAVAQANLGFKYELGQGVPQDEREAAAWLLKSAEQGYATAQSELGFLYSSGRGVAKDDKVAVNWFRKAAEQGNAEAQFSLALRYAKGEGVAQDFKKAANSYKKAAEQGHAGAQNNLGNLYADGHGVTQDYREAVSWYRASAAQGNPVAQYNLGIRYANGEGVVQDFKEAASWYRKAAEQGDAGAQNDLGVMYVNGEGVPKDLVIAYALYNLAATGGAKPAPKNRAELLDMLTSRQIEEGQTLSAKWKVGTPLPTGSKTGHATSPTKTAALPKPPVQSAKVVTAAPQPTAAAKTGNCRPRGPSIRCESSCYNGDCVVKYENGCQVRVRVSAKFNPFNSQWEYPSPPC